MRWASLSVSMVAYDGHPLETALASLAALGVDVVELAYIEGYSATFDEAMFSAANAEAVRAALAQAGLTCRAVSAHFDLSRPGGDDALCRRLEFTSAVGAQMVATVSGPAVQRDAFVEHLTQATKLAEQLGVTIGLENPADDADATINGGPDAAQFAAAFDHPLVRINYDPGNFLTHRPGLPPQRDIEPALPYLVGLHLKDLRREGEGWVHSALGDGSVDWDQMFDRIATLDPSPFLSIEIPTRMRRDSRGRIVLDSQTVPLAQTEALLTRSIALVNAERARFSEGRTEARY